ncbi:hypothetical protein FKM82_000292 [Ascaphus truei]
MSACPPVVLGKSKHHSDAVALPGSITWPGIRGLGCRGSQVRFRGQGRRQRGSQNQLKGRDWQQAKQRQGRAQAGKGTSTLHEQS